MVLWEVPVDETKKHDRAYLSFIPPAILGFALFVANMVPMGTGTAGGVGFLVLIPLSLLSLMTVPRGIWHALSFFRDRWLVVLALATVLVVVAVFADFDSPAVTNLLIGTYSLYAVMCIGSWFLFRRRVHVKAFSTDLETNGVNDARQR